MPRLKHDSALLYNSSRSFDLNFQLTIFFYKAKYVSIKEQEM